MKRSIHKLAKPLRLAAAIALAFTMSTALAANMTVKVTGHACDFVRGFWVEYELNGIKYRSDKAGVRINQMAWANMSDEDRQTTVENVYGVFNAREEQFGDKAQEMGYWYDKKKGWVQGAEILTDSLVKRDFPSLYEKFTPHVIDEDWTGDYFSEIMPSNDKGRTREIDNLVEEAELTWEWAREAYKTIGKATYIKTAVAVKSTSGDLIELICDRCLVPNITPAGAGGLAASAVGTVIDYINNVAGIQSGIIKNVVGQRTTSDAALEVIERCNMVNTESIKFINTCISRIKEIAQAVKEKKEEYDKAIADSEKKWEELWSADDPLFSATNVEIIAQIDKLKEAISDAQHQYNDYHGGDSDERERLEKAVKAAEKAYADYVAEKAADVHAQFNAYLGAMGSRVAAFIADFDATMEELKAAEPERGDLYHNGTYDLSADDAAERISTRRKYVEWAENYYAVQSRFADEAPALADEASQSLMPTHRDFITLWKHAYGYVDEDLDSALGSAASAITQVRVIGHGDVASRITDLVNPAEELAAFEERHSRLSDEIASTRKMYEDAKAEVVAAKAAVEKAYADYRKFIDELPAFVTEQHVGEPSQYPGLHNGTSPLDLDLIELNPDTELGRTFLDADHPASVTTATSYRDRLNAFGDEHASLVAKIDYAETVYSGMTGTLKYRTRALRWISSAHKEGEIAVADYDVPDTDFTLESSYRKTSRALVALSRDFNNRNPSHETEMDIFGDLAESEATYAAGDELRYSMVSGTAHCYAHSPDNSRGGLNPMPLYGYWNESEYKPNATNYYHRGVGSYAYYAPGYYETVFAGEPDPYNDLVSPILRSIEVARAAAIGITLHVVTFDANGGNIDMATRTVENGAAVGELPAPTRNGWTFGGWWTAASGGTQVTEATIVSANVTYYAHWTQGGGEGGGGGQGGGSGGGQGGEAAPDPVNPGYDVIDAKDIVAPYEAPKAVTLQGVAYDGDAVAGAVELKLGKVNAKKGTSKVSGSFTGLDGKKITLKAVNVTGIDGTVPATVSMDVKGHGTMTVTVGGDKFAGSLGGWHVQSGTVGGNWAKGTATVGVDAGDVSMFAGTVQTDLLPNDEQATANGGRWAFKKAAGVKWAKPKKGAEPPEVYDEASGKGLIVDTSANKTNLSGLKLTYTPKKGTFKGSFKVYALEGVGKTTKLKKYTVTAQLAAGRLQVAVP